VQNVVTFAKNYGSIKQYYDGVDLTLNARLPRGVFVGGGINAGREVYDSCDVVGQVEQPATTTFELTQSSLGLVSNTSGMASPSALYCRTSPSFWGQTQMKMQATYPLPWWGVRTSATFQSNPGPMIVATYVAPNAAVAPSLGRNLAAGAAGTSTVQLIQPGTIYGDRLNQIDFRVSKAVRVNRARVEAQLDLYNLFNASPVTAENTRYGPNWRQPLAILQGRLIKIGAQVTF
jgi:hypothetical protein